MGCENGALLFHEPLGHLLFLYGQWERDDDATHDISQLKILLAAQNMSIVTIHTGL